MPRALIHLLDGGAKAILEPTKRKEKPVTLERIRRARHARWKHMKRHSENRSFNNDQYTASIINPC